MRPDKIARMGKRGRRSRRDAWWRQSVGGITVGALLAVVGAFALVVAGVALFSLRPTASDAATPEYTPRTYSFETEEPSKREPLVLPENPQVLIVGDSYVQGYGADDEKTQGWAPLVAASLGWDATVDGIGGTGWIWGGGSDGTLGQQYINRINAFAQDSEIAPDMVVFQGGPNDYRSTFTEVSNAVVATVDATRAAWPDAEIVIVGIAAPGQTGLNLAPMNSTVILAAGRADARSINVINDHVFTTKNSAGFTAPDGGHPNTAGYAFLAEYITTVFQGWSS
jgi:lysophospholipase L1-like esterase